MLLPPEHPYWHVRAVVEESVGSVFGVNFSYYKYTPQSVVDVRRAFYVPVSDFLDPACVVDVMRGCPPGWELAVHSELFMADGARLHIPMVDMSTGSLAQLSKLKPILGQGFEDFTWYKSGRSYHGYGRTLVNYSSWVALMGTLLLANQMGVPPTVDPRWVGHRLIAGYAALRWTKNTSHYLGMPRRLPM